MTSSEPFSHVVLTPSLLLRTWSVEIIFWTVQASAAPPPAVPQGHVPACSAAPFKRALFSTTSNDYMSANDVLKSMDVVSPTSCDWQPLLWFAQLTRHVLCPAGRHRESCSTRSSMLDL